MTKTHNKFEGLEVTDEDFPAMADIDIYNMQIKIKNKVNKAAESEASGSINGSNCSKKNLNKKQRKAALKHKLIELQLRTLIHRTTPKTLIN